MNSQSLLLKTSMFFLIVLTHSALTKRDATAFHRLETAAAKDAGQIEGLVLHLGFDGKTGDSVEYPATEKTNEVSRFAPGLVNQSLRIGLEGLPSFAAIQSTRSR